MKVLSKIVLQFSESRVPWIISGDQAVLWMVLSFHPSICLSHHFHVVPLLISSWQKCQGQRSNVTIGQNNWPTIVWIHRWLQYDAQSLKWHRRRALLLWEVICQMSHGPTHRRFWPELRVSVLKLHFEVTDGNKMMHKSWSGIEEVFLGIIRQIKITQTKKSMIWLQFQCFRVI